MKTIKLIACLLILTLHVAKPEGSEIINLSKRFIIVITSYNNAQWYKENLDSVLFQDYDNYHIIYIDDASTDRTPELVEEYVKSLNKESLISIIRNNEWESQEANHYKAVHMCHDTDIIVHLDGDDHLNNNQVLSLLNTVYADPFVWLTYGQNSFQCCRPFTREEIESGEFRPIHPAYFTHLRTFYAWLFKQIKLQDLFFEGTFKSISGSPDTGFMYPMVEMCGFHSRFIPNVLYIWNRINAISQTNLHLESQLNVEHTIRSWEKYKPLANPIINSEQQFYDSKVDIIILLFNNVQFNLDIIQSIKEYTQGTIKIYIVYDKNNYVINEDELKAIDRLFKPFNPTLATTDFKSIFGSIISSAHDHVVLIPNNVVFCAFVDFNNCIRNLEKTFAQGFILMFMIYKIMLICHLKYHFPKSLAVWQFKYGNYIWDEPKKFKELYTSEHRIKSKVNAPEWTAMFSIEGVLYRKDTLLMLSEFSLRRLTVY